MKKVLMIAAILLFALGAVAQAQDTVVPNVAAEGIGEVQVEPNQAAITFGVVTQAKTAADAQGKNAELANAVYQSILALGIDNKDIKTQDYSVQPQYVYEKGETTKIKGYLVSNNVRVQVKDVKLVGKVIDAALQAGANEASSIEWKVADNEAYKLQALELAVKNAKAKIEIMAKAAGHKVKRIVAIAENGISVPEYRMPRVSAMMDNAKAATPVAPGTMDFKATVKVVAEIE